MEDLKKIKFETNLHYYSERGMVNAIITSIYNYKSAAFHFLKCIKKIDNTIIFNHKLEDIIKIDIYDEYSLGGFGSPDLIIKVFLNNKQSYLFFIEAKVGTYADSVKNISIKENYKNNASRINFQLRLKYRFVEAIMTNNNKEIITSKVTDKLSAFDYKDRILKKNTLVQFANKLMENQDKNNIYYVSMTNDNSNPFLLNKDYLPCLEDEMDFYNHLAYILYENKEDRNDRTVLWKCKDKSVETNTVLYGKTYEMFTESRNNAMNIDDSYDYEEDDQ